MSTLTDNQALNELVTLVGQIEVAVRNGYNGIEGTAGIAASNASPYTRNPVPTAVRTVILNTGSQTLRLQENGILIAEIEAGDEWRSATACSGTLTIDTAGAAGQFSIATYYL